MKLGDRGNDILEFQKAMGFPEKACDGVCGYDTWLRWRAETDANMPWQLRRFAKLIGVIDTYSMANPGPRANDCSGSVCIALNVPKAPGGANTTGRWLNTDGIIVDAENTRRLFIPVPLADLQPGDLVCYGHSKSGVGHVAMVVDPAAQVIIDCSGSRNGVHCHVDDKAGFWKTKPGRVVYGLRFVGPSPAKDLT